MNKYYEKLLEDIEKEIEEEIGKGLYINIQNEFDVHKLSKYTNIGFVRFLSDEVSNRIIRLDEAPFVFLVKLKELFPNNSHSRKREIYGIDILNDEILLRVNDQKKYNERLFED